MLQYGWAQHGKLKKPHAKEAMLYDLIYIKGAELTNL